MNEPSNSPPNALPREAAAMLARYRAAKVMPARARTRVRHRLAQTNTAPARAAAKVPWVAAAIAVAAVVALGWGWSVIRSTSEAANHAPGAAAMYEDASASVGGNAGLHRGAPAVPADRRGAPASQPPDPSPATPSDSRAPTAPPAHDATQPDATQATTDHARPRPQPRARSAERRVQARHAPPAPDAAPAELSGLAAERAILARAWAALARREHGAALAETRTHRRRFIDGILNVERQAIAAIASCNANRSDADIVAAAFLHTHGKTPLAPRVRQACPGGGAAPADDAK